MPPLQREIEDIYKHHPLSRTTLLARVLRDKGSLSDLTELDLALDRKTEITDQNHVGGAAAVERLGCDAGVHGRSYVLDLGCGLGRPARLLAQRFGCRVDGIDLSAVCVRDARALTRLVYLSDRVTIRRGDIMRVHVPRQRYDVLWGQSAWVHIADKETLIARWRAALRARGRLALQDSCVRRPVKNRREAALLDRLERDWASALISARQWAALAERAGLKVSTLTQSSRPFLPPIRRPISLPRDPPA